MIDYKALLRVLVAVYCASVAFYMTSGKVAESIFAGFVIVSGVLTITNAIEREN